MTSPLLRSSTARWIFLGSGCCGLTSRRIGNYRFLALWVEAGGSTRAQNLARVGVQHLFRGAVFEQHVDGPLWRHSLDLTDPKARMHEPIPFVVAPRAVVGAG